MALVTKSYFEFLQKRNRAAWKEFRVVAELPPQHIAVFLISNDAPPELASALRAQVLNAKETDAGRHVLDIYRLDGFRACGMEEFREPELRLLAKLDAAAAQGKDATPAPAPSPFTPAPTTAPSPEAASIGVGGIEVERDSDTGEVSAVIRFKKEAPPGVKALVGLDDGPEQSADLECQAGTCVLTLSADRVRGKRKLSLLLVLEKDGKTSPLGARRTYPLHAR